MVTEVRPLQYRKAELPMLVTELGIVTEVKRQYAKACAPILVTELGIIVFIHPAISVFDDVSIIPLQLLRESYFAFPSSTFIEVRLVQ